MKTKTNHDGTCRTCLLCKMLQEKNCKTYCFAPRKRKDGTVRPVPFEVQLHFKCSNNKYKPYNE